MNPIDFPRLTEIKVLCDDLNHYDGYFNDIEKCLKSNVAYEKYFKLEHELQKVDQDAWEILKQKTINYFTKITSRGWQQLFEALNEAKGYVHLASAGCSSIIFIPEANIKTPDIEAQNGQNKYLLEVKTINISEQEALNRQEKMRDHDVQYKLGDVFLQKIDRVIEKASFQLQNYKIGKNYERIVLLVVNFDEENFSVTSILTQKIEKHIQQHSYSCDTVVVKNAY